MAHYGAALLAVLLCTALSSMMTYVSGSECNQGLYLTAIAGIGWWFGRGPALAATLVSTLTAGGFFSGTWQFVLGQHLEQDLSLLLMGGEGCVISWLTSSIREASIQRNGSTMDRNANDAVDYRRIVESLRGCAIVLLDQKGCIASWSGPAERLMGYSLEQLLGKPFSQLNADAANDGTAFQHALDVAGNGGSGTVQMRCLRQGGTEFWADIVIGGVRNDDGQPIGYAIVLRDVTARKQAEDLLEQRSRQLVEASRLKDEFLATISHELRTPLNSILGWAQLFRAGRLDDAGRIHAMETIEHSAKTQARLIEDLLDVSRIVTGKMRLEVRSVQMAEVVEAAVETIRPAAEAKGISIQLTLDSSGCPVAGDPNRLQQVVWNLLSNAIKFTPHDGHVSIQLARYGSSVRLLVKDDGIGIHADFLPYIFDAFRQADSTSSRAHKGLGLGLSIVRRLIELHGGTVRAESEGEELGTTFEILLPVASSSKSSPSIATFNNEVKSSAPAVTSRLTSAGMEPVRVLVVDDDTDARELVSVVLSHSGIQVDAVASASDGLSAIERLKPDVIISDIEMPGEDGYAFIQELRSMDAEHGGRTPAVALTAYTRPEDRSRSLAAGFQLHLAKPVDADELVNAIIALANQRRKGTGHAKTTRN